MRFQTYKEVMLNRYIEFVPLTIGYSIDRVHDDEESHDIMPLVQEEEHDRMERINNGMFYDT